MPDIRRAIYPGTFDPITNGHLDVLARAAEMFDEVIVAITTANGKDPLFTKDERKVVVEKAVAEVLPEKKNIKVDTFGGLIVDYAKNKKAIALIRGLRAVSDFEYEMQMALMNRKLSGISTVFLAPHEQYTYLNSTIVRELVKHGGDVSAFVPKSVADALKKRS